MATRCVLFAMFCLVTMAFLETYGFPEKRILLKDNYYAIMEKLQNLTDEVQQIKAATG